VELVGARTRYGVDAAAYRAAILGRYVRGEHLELKDGVFGRRVTDARVATLDRLEGLVIVRAVDHEVVLEVGSTAEGDETEGAVAQRYARAQESECRPMASIDRKRAQGERVELGRKVRGFRVDDRRFRAHIDRCRCSGRAHLGRHFGQLTDFDGHMRGGVVGEAADSHLDLIDTRNQARHAEVPAAVGRCRHVRIGCRVMDHNLSVRQRRACAIDDRTCNGSVYGGLRPRRRSAHARNEQQQAQATSEKQ
jgi:hypothetical protein